MKKRTYSLLVTLAFCTNLWSETDISPFIRALSFADSNSDEINPEEKKQRQDYFDKLSGNAEFDKRLQQVRKLYTARLTKAIRDNGTVDEVRSYIEDYEANINAHDEYHWTPLITALLYSRDDVVTLLIEKKVDVNARDERGETPVMQAVSHGNIDALKKLIDAGADVNAKDNRDETALHDAARNGNIEAIAILATAGADVNVKENHHGDTVLMNVLYCANTRNKDNIISVMKALIEAGADVNAQRKDGHSVLECAAWHAKDHNDFSLIIRTLVDAGADISAVYNRGIDRGFFKPYRLIIEALKQHNTKK